MLELARLLHVHALLISPPIECLVQHSLTLHEVNLQTAGAVSNHVVHAAANANLQHQQAENVPTFTTNMRPQALLATICNSGRQAGISNSSSDSHQAAKQL